MPETVFLSLQYANVILLQGEGQHGEDSDQIPGENGMIYITGDTHGDFARFSAKRLRRAGMELTQEDYIIICGDFGLCWAKDKTFEYHCKNFAEKPYPILWVQGNHENYDLIGEYPLEEWHGGKVRHIIRDKVILLERGQVFEIEGKSFFAFGGASSHDIQGGILDRQTVDFAEQKRRADRAHLPYRILQESWWPQKLHYKHWYFGHYHRDCQPDERHTLVYYAILPLEQKESAAAVPVPGQMGGETDHGKG